MDFRGLWNPATPSVAPIREIYKVVKNKLKVMNPDGTEAVDGLKTGYIDAGGSSVVITGSRGGKRAVAVVLGSSSSKERDEHAARLISDALGAIAW